MFENSPCILFIGNNDDYIVDVSTTGKNGITAQNTHSIGTGRFGSALKPENKLYAIFGFIIQNLQKLNLITMTREPGTFNTG